MELKPETQVTIVFDKTFEVYTIAELMEAHPGVMVSDMSNMVEDIFDQIEGAEAVEIGGYLISK